MDWGGCVWETHGCGLWKSIIRMGLDKFLEYIHFDVMLVMVAGFGYGMTDGVVINLCG